MANLGFYKKISPYGAILISELGSGKWKHCELTVFHMTK